jgi:hypothetical protein
MTALQGVGPYGPEADFGLRFIRDSPLNSESKDRLGLGLGMAKLWLRIALTVPVSSRIFQRSRGRDLYETKFTR